MLKARIVITVLVVAVTCAAVSAAASAKSWHVNGTVLSGHALISESTTLSYEVVLHAESSPTAVTIKCSVFKPEELQLAGGTDKINAEGLIFGGCYVWAGPSGCEMTESDQSEIFTEALSGTIEGEDEITFLSLARVKNLLATIEFNNHCGTLSGKQSLVGGLTGYLWTGETEKTEHELWLRQGATGLTLGGVTAELAVNSVVKLLSGLPWSFR
jgi:hypothetical protein